MDQEKAELNQQENETKSEENEKENQVSSDQIAENPINSCKNIKLDDADISAETDPHYQTILKIYNYFRQIYSIPNILSALHKCAGDVHDAMHLLKTAADPTQFNVDFSYRRIASTQLKTESYFQSIINISSK